MDNFSFHNTGSRFALIILLLGMTIFFKGLWVNVPGFLSNNVQHRSQLSCNAGSFILKGMKSCHPWLSCLEIEKEVWVTERYLGSGAEKIVKEGYWQDHPVAVNILRHEDFFHDFQHNLNMLKLFSNESSPQVNKIVQLVGWCFHQQTPVIITELHPLGAANNIHAVLKENFPSFDTLEFRFGLCIDFVNILHILHSHPDGPRVMCDANDPDKALSQFLLSENGSLILNDMDALPLVNKSSGELVKCGHRELHGDYVAPEQLWPYDTKMYDDGEMPHYDEKVDIWKIPDVCNFLLGDMTGASKLQLHLFGIHSECKKEDPQLRPSARMVLNYYKTVRLRLGWNIFSPRSRDEG
ncbi:unnamed protein product [Candidula unifasciata]|uniref:Protein O-mannose kinase n=1 Tax=Candidula unifasciata TaxID=100452 RepID=A0A8S4A3H0_9EUPU|nr:unnamed protein product [Candidula unifasciata]